MIEMTHKTICVNCGHIGTSCHETLHFPKFTSRNDESPVYCYYCPVCGLQVRIHQAIDGEVLEHIQRPPQYEDCSVNPYYHTVADLLYAHYDPARKHSVFAIPQLDLQCPRHGRRMLLSANWLARPPLDCEQCGGTRFVVPFDQPPSI